MSVGIVGLGYVGLPLAVSFAEAGERVVGVDVDVRRVDALRRGESYVEDLPSRCLRAVGHRIEPTTGVAALARADAIVVCVPTPLTASQEPDLGPLTDAGRAIATVLRRGQLVVLESTTYPGATRERLLPLLEESGLAAGRDFHLAFSPQRVDPGRADWTLRTTPKLVAGLTGACADRAEALYAAVCHRVVRVSTLETAELAKLLENLFRAVNVALVNELALVADRLALDMREVVDAAATKPFGFMRFDPGPGLGGHCLSVDPFALAWRARELDVPTDLVEVAGRLNRRAPEHGVAQVERALNDLGRPVRGARIAVLGAGRKAGVGDIRESAAVKIIGRLGRMGAAVAYHDPRVAELRAFGLTSLPLDEALAGADVAVAVTPVPGLDHDAIAARLPLVDLCGAASRPPVARGPAGRVRDVALAGRAA
jgi:UDP-N-acetyl-D-glucosamine dehydrogenase